jgi:hypothetical protein
MEAKNYHTFSYLKKKPTLTDSDRSRLARIISDAEIVRRNREPDCVNGSK